ncbi:MAG TPA: xanthine dehydrogenase family protein molybdopterin-binding subunit, partial [Acidimicrobiales bacterium]|nr:xanthine dehydrogenase family protein molybdopterin-binding subunit [Acidimicrobiales bacterium]
MRRKEDPRLLTGHGRYVDDVEVPRMLHAAFLRSEVARARITGIDVSAATALPGVTAVFTGARLNPEAGPAWHAMLGGDTGAVPFRVLADHDVRFVGDPIALVVAGSRYIAEDACELIEIDLDVQPAMVDYVSAPGATDVVVHPEKGTNAMMAVPFMALSPDLDEAFSTAAHVVEETIVQHRYLPVPMEGRGLIASWDSGTSEIDVVCSNQSVHEARSYLARLLGVPESSVRVHVRDVGGAFGQKMFMAREESAVALASRLLGRPVKWIEDRRENLIAAPHARNETARVRMALDSDGVIQAITADNISDLGAYAVCPAGMDPTLLTGPYKVPRLGFGMTMAFSNTMGKGAYRGPWMFETTAREMMVDLAARQIGLDPLELRRRNIIRPEDLPWTNPAGRTFEEVTPSETLEQAVELLDIVAFRREQAAARPEGRYLGVGFSAYIEPSSMASSTLYTEGATVRVEPGGRVTAFLGTTSHGQSIETTMAQVVADNLGVDIADVTIVQADSGSTPYGPGTGGSRTAVIAGGAARAAALEVREKVVRVVAQAMEASPGDLEVSQGVVSVKGTPARSMTLAEVARLVYVDPGGVDVGQDAGLEATVRFRPGKFPTYSNATHACVVEIDGQTWIPRIRRFIVSEDCGRMINPMVVEGQIFGGVAQGMGGVLLEHFIYDD